MRFVSFAGSYPGEKVTYMLVDLSGPMLRLLGIKEPLGFLTLLVLGWLAARHGFEMMVSGCRDAMVCARTAS